MKTLRFLLRWGERLDGQRQPHDELAAARGSFATRLDAAAVHSDQVLDHREANSETTLTACLRLIDLREHLENSRQHVGGDADAGIAHGEYDVGPLALRGEPNLTGLLVAALFSRLAITCVSRTGSPSSVTGSDGSAIAS